MSELILDPVAALPRLGAMRAALLAGDWTACRTVLEEATPVERTMLIRHGSGGADVEGFLRWVLDGQPVDSTAAALLAGHLIQVAWSIRTASRARYVSATQAEGFHDVLRRAEGVLTEAAARNPDDPALWVLRVTSARGLELGVSEVRRRYDRLATIDPHHLPGQSQLLQALCPKWGGSWELAHGLGQEVMRMATPGSLNPVIVAEMHIEHWVEFAERRVSAGRRYLAGAAVRGEITEAAQRSVLHPDFRPTPGWVGVVSTFAFVFSELGDQATAGLMFDRLGPLGTEAPWDYLTDTPAALQRERRARAARRRRGR